MEDQKHRNLRQEKKPTNMSEGGTNQKETWLKRKGKFYGNKTVRIGEGRENEKKKKG